MLLSKNKFKHVAHLIVSSSLTSLTFQVHFSPASTEALSNLVLGGISLSEKEK